MKIEEIGKNWKNSTFWKLSRNKEIVTEWKDKFDILEIVRVEKNGILGKYRGQSEMDIFRKYRGQGEMDILKKCRRC